MNNEKYKTIEYTSPVAQKTITLEVGDYGTIKWNGQKLGSCVISSTQGYRYASRPLGSGFKGMLPVHRIVALAWCKRKDGCDFVDHINSNRLDNRASNLRWLSRKENNSRFHTRRMKSINASQTNHKNQIIRMEKDGQVQFAVNGYRVAEMIGCSHVLVYNVLNPEHWAKTAKGWSLKWVKIASR